MSRSTIRQSALHTLKPLDVRLGEVATWLVVLIVVTVASYRIVQSMLAIEITVGLSWAMSNPVLAILSRLFDVSGDSITLGRWPLLAIHLATVSLLVAAVRSRFHWSLATSLAAGILFASSLGPSAGFQSADHLPRLLSFLFLIAAMCVDSGDGSLSRRRTALTVGAVVIFPANSLLAYLVHWDTRCSRREWQDWAGLVAAGGIALGTGWWAAGSVALYPGTLLWTLSRLLTACYGLGAPPGEIYPWEIELGALVAVALIVMSVRGSTYVRAGALWCIAAALPTLALPDSMISLSTGPSEHLYGMTIVIATGITGLLCRFGVPGLPVLIACLVAGLTSLSASAWNGLGAYEAGRIRPATDNRKIQLFEEALQSGGPYVRSICNCACLALSPGRRPRRLTPLTESFRVMLGLSCYDLHWRP
jgi:hypothetical protein